MKGSPPQEENTGLSRRGEGRGERKFMGGPSQEEIDFQQKKEGRSATNT